MCIWGYFSNYNWNPDVTICIISSRHFKIITLARNILNLERMSIMIFRKKKRVIETKKIKDERTIDNTLILKSIYYIDMNTGTNVKVNVFVI